MAQMERKEKIRHIRLALAEMQIIILFEQSIPTELNLDTLLVHKFTEKEYCRLLNRLDKDKECQYHQL